MPDYDHYDLNDPVRREVTFTVNGANTDPTAVTAQVIRPDSTTQTYTYNTDPELTKVSTGIYRLSISASTIGTWYVIFTGTGTAAGTYRDTFIVDPKVPSDLLASNALTTIENVELMLSRVGSYGGVAAEADDQRWIARLINGYSTTIQAETRRQFKPVQNPATKLFWYDGSGVLDLGDEQTEISAITSITAYTDHTVGDQEIWTAGYTGAATDYWAEPRNKTPEGTYLWLRLPRLVSPTQAQVTIVGAWGAGTVPTDVAYVCESEVAHAYLASVRPTPGGAGQPSGEEQTGGPQLGPWPLSRRSIAMLERHSNRPAMVR